MSFGFCYSLNPVRRLRAALGPRGYRRELELMVSPRQELEEVFSWMKEQLTQFEELGLDPPPLSAQCMAYLDQEPVAPVSKEMDLDRIETLEELSAFIGKCTRCPLHRGRKHLVFGEGSPKARLVFVGEAPGREEDLIGRPFVGEAGRLLTRIIENGMGLKREDVYICNVVKCRPPRNRDPEKEEVEICLPFLKRQIQIIRPEVICILGRVAAQALLGKDFKITQDRGKWNSFEGIPVMPTYHPAYVLRNPRAKRPVWEDVQQIMARLGLEVRKNA